MSRLAPVGRGDRHPLLLLADLLPHLALGDAAGERLRGEHLGLAAAQVGVRDVRGRVEVDRGAVPAALLDAGDGDRQLRAGADEHRDVEDPVLLGADELLAVVEQHGLVERVDDGELGHRAGVGGLADREAARQRLVERDVAGDRVAGREERGDDDAAVLDRVAELEGEGEVSVMWCSFRGRKGVRRDLACSYASSSGCRFAACRLACRAALRRGVRRRSASLAGRRAMARHPGQILHRVLEVLAGDLALRVAHPQRGDGRIGRQGARGRSGRRNGRSRRLGNAGRESPDEPDDAADQQATSSRTITIAWSGPLHHSSWAW